MKKSFIIFASFLLPALWAPSLSASEQTLDTRTAYRESVSAELFAASRLEKEPVRPAKDRRSETASSAPFPAASDDPFSHEPFNTSAGAIVEA